MPRSSTDTAGGEADRRAPGSTQEPRIRTFNFTMHSLLEAARSAPVDAEVRAAMEELAAQLASTSAREAGGCGSRSSAASRGVPREIRARHGARRFANASR